MTAYTTTTTKSSGQGVSSTEWNALANNDTHFSEILNWTPTVTQSATVTKNVTSGWYGQAGTRVWAACKLALTSSGTSSNAVLLTLPVTAAAGLSSNACIGSFVFVDASDSSRIWAGSCLTQSTTTFGFAINNATNILGGTGNTFTAAVASGDTLTVQIMYQAA